MLAFETCLNFLSKSSQWPTRFCGMGSNLQVMLSVAWQVSHNSPILVWVIKEENFLSGEELCSEVKPKNGWNAPEVDKSFSRSDTPTCFYRRCHLELIKVSVRKSEKKDPVLLCELLNRQKPTSEKITTVVYEKSLKMDERVRKTSAMTGATSWALCLLYGTQYICIAPTFFCFQQSESTAETGLDEI